MIILLYNIIIVGDDEKRAWFSQYLKCMQQKVMTTLCVCFVLHGKAAFFSNKKPLTYSQVEQMFVYQYCNKPIHINFHIGYLVSETSTVSCYSTSLLPDEETVLILEKALLPSRLHPPSARTAKSAIFRRRVHGR